MFFGLFGKKEKKPVFTDRNFMHEKAKLKAILQLAKEADDTIFIAWFPETAARYRTAFEQNGLHPERIVDAKQFHSSRAIGRTLIFLEHHPLRSKEEAMLQHLPAQEVIVYNSLDEPLFELFGGERIIDLMTKMGMKEDEPLQHSLISRSIEKAQEKIAKKVTLESPAASQRDWIDRNAR